MALTEPQQTEYRIPEWTLGDRLKKARETAGLEQKDMAEYFDVSVSTISSWENDGGAGRSHSIFEVIEGYAEFCNVDPFWITPMRRRSSGLSQNLKVLNRTHSHLRVVE